MVNEPNYFSRYRDWTAEDRFVVGIRHFFLFSTASRPAQGLTQPPIQWVPGALCPVTRRPECEADHSFLFRAEVHNCSCFYTIVVVIVIFSFCVGCLLCV
jgi:hypothetical protein